MGERPRVRPARERTWQELLRTAVRDPLELVSLLGVTDAWASESWRAAADFRVFAPRGYIAKMNYGDPHDPLLRQVLPLDAERAPAAGFVPDPVGDGAARREAGLLHKYTGRALLVVTGACAIHCRYCFRRHYPYSEGPRSSDDWTPALDVIAADPTIEEVILSGGDPLTLVDAPLAELTERIAAIGHVRRLRVHTRLPIVIPERVTGDLLAWLRGTRLTPLVVVHANHPREVDEPVIAALGRCVDAGIPVLNQAVLLRGVNDNEETLAALCRRLVDARVQPYYLHQLDRVAGAAHFEVPPERGQQLIAALRASLPGYAVPRYVCEVAGETSKRPLA